MRKLFIAFAFIFLSVAGYSQFVIFGAKAGLNLASFTANYVESPNIIPSFHAGAFANFLISGKFMLQPEVLYAGKGAKYDGGKYLFNYVDIPVLAQYKTPSGFYLEAGPQIGFLINAKRKLNGQSNSEAEDIKNVMKSYDLSWVAGIGYKLPVGVGVAARYDFGYSNAAASGTIKNKTILISVFYTFGGTSDE
jgi:hypothetical protein